MHEMSIMMGVIDAVEQAVKEHNAVSVNSVTLEIGDMSEVVEDSLEFAFEAISPGTVMEGSQLIIQMIKPTSKCLDCGYLYEHDRFQMTCPKCESFFLEQLTGREMSIKSIDVQLPDADEE